MMYDKLFTPMKIGTLTVKNRLIMPAMNSHCADGEHHFTEQALNYYGERVLGGFGLLITEFCASAKRGWLTPCRRVFTMIDLFQVFPG